MHEFLSGLEMSDVVFTHSQTSKDYLRKLYAKYSIHFCEEKFKINPPPYDPFLLDNHKRKVFNTERVLC